MPVKYVFAMFRYCEISYSRILTNLKSGNNMNTESKTFSVRTIVYPALFTAALCVLSPFSINIGPIPISLATSIIYLAACCLGAKHGTISVIIYILLGAVGMPVFTNYGAGLQKIVGPTGGFIIGYIPLVYITGLFADYAKSGKIKKVLSENISVILGMILGTLLLYTCGLIWFIYLTESSLSTSLALCVYPFIPGDIAKMVFTMVIFSHIRTRNLVYNMT